MRPNRITPGGATLAALLSAVLLVAAVAGCGGGSSTEPAASTPGDPGIGGAAEVSTPTSSAELSPDGEILQGLLGRQEAAIEAFAEVGRALPPRLERLAAFFRAQEQEHVDAVLKILRGMGVGSHPIVEPIDTAGLKDVRERLVFLYEVESATIDEELSAISKLEAGYPRSLLASAVANAAQHLSLLRRALGAGPLASVPVPFENGTAPPPEEGSGPRPDGPHRGRHAAARHPRNRALRQTGRRCSRSTCRTR